VDFSFAGGRLLALRAQAINAADAR
jgi:hypothetical protein